MLGGGGLLINPPSAGCEGMGEAKSKSFSLARSGRGELILLCLVCVCEGVYVHLCAIKF